MGYETLKELVEASGKKLPCSATNEKGEFVIIERGCSEDKVDYFQTTTLQSNDWLRTNTFYADGVTTETFER